MFTHRTPTFLSIACVLLSSCALMNHGRFQKVPVVGVPSEATVRVGDQVLDRDGCVTLERGKEHVFIVERDGQPVKEINVRQRLSGWLFWDSIPGWFVDGATGAAFNLRPTVVDVREGDTRGIIYRDVVCEPYRPRIRFSPLFGYSLLVSPSNVKRGEPFGQFWGVFGFRGQGRIEFIVEPYIIVLRERTAAGSTANLQLYGGPPLPFGLMPAGFNYYFLQGDALEPYVGWSLSLFTNVHSPDEDGLEAGPLGVHGGVRYRFARKIEGIVQLRYFGVNEFAIFGDPDPIARALVLNYGIGGAW